VNFGFAAAGAAETATSATTVRALVRNAIEDLSRCGVAL
jgi:hypothetical protein